MINIIIFKKGDLLKSDCDIILHQANCQTNMGAGIAKQIKNTFPEAFLADKNFPLKQKERFGKFSFAWSKNEKIKGKKLIVNLYGQIYPGKSYNEKEQQERYNALKNSLNSLFFFVKKENEKSGKTLKIGLPYLMGCDLAGGDWKIVEKILKELSEQHKLDLYIYQLEK